MLKWRKEMCDGLHEYFNDWNDLTEEEQDIALSYYISAREDNECRLWNEVTEDYPEPMDLEGVKYCVGYEVTRYPDGGVIVEVDI